MNCPDLISGQLQNYVSQTITKTYDTRNRLLKQLSGLLTYHLYYDDVTPAGLFGQSINASQNWNGNINGMTVSYLPSNSTNYGGLGWGSDFSSATIYGYEYDRLNRLTRADATQGNAIDRSGSVVSSMFGVGDAFYQFDKIGNITSLQRGVEVKDNNNQYQLETHSWNYEYAPGNNHLLAAVGNGQTTTRQYSYDLMGRF